MLKKILFGTLLLFLSVHLLTPVEGHAHVLLARSTEMKVVGKIGGSQQPPKDIVDDNLTITVRVPTEEDELADSEIYLTKDKQLGKLPKLGSHTTNLILLVGLFMILVVCVSYRYHKRKEFI